MGSYGHGGLGLPNTHQYYQAMALQHLLDCKLHTPSKLWVSLEKDYCWSQLIICSLGSNGRQMSLRLGGQQGHPFINRMR